MHSNLRSKLNIRREESHTFQYVGIVLENNGHNTYLYQGNYADKLTFIQISRVRAMQPNTELTPNEIESLRSKIEHLLWIAHQSRADILFDSCNLAANVKNCKVQNILIVNKVIERLKSGHVPLKFQHLGDGKLSLFVFSDATLGNLPDGGSQGGYLIFLVGQKKLFSLIHWNFKKLEEWFATP